MNVNYFSKMGPQLLQTSTRTRCLWLVNGTWQLQETTEPQPQRNKSHGFGTSSRHSMNEYNKINLTKGVCYNKRFKGFTIGSASLARSIRIRFHFRHRTGRIRSVSDHRAGRVWRLRHRSKTPNCLPGARDQVPALFRNAVERRGASVVDPNSGAPITQSTFDMLPRMANPLSLLNWWLHEYDNENDYALFQV